jgi:L-fucose isomerase-like protein
MAKKTTFAVLVGNRGFFPGHLCEEGRKTVLRVLDEQGYGALCLTPNDTPYGSVVTREHARKWAALMQAHKADIDGIIITLPNFGEERGIVEAIEMADLRVPILVQATPDTAGLMSIKDRRDSFCGKMSTCNNLTQYGIPFSLTERHTIDPETPAFAADLSRFAATCRVVRGLRGARFGAIGARPAAFNTVRYSEKLLQANGITVEVVDLSEIFGRIGKLDDNAATVQAKLAEIKDYIDVGRVPEKALIRMAKLGAVVGDWIEENEVVATAVQCWTSMEEFFGVVPCTVMSMLSNKLMPSACEVDITGALGMYALTLASGEPAALVDWNNNYDDDPDKCVLFHCSNLPKGCMSHCCMSQQDIIGGAVGDENAQGTVVGRIKSGEFTYCRVSTNDEMGTIDVYTGEGEFTDDPLETFGGAGVAYIPDLQGLLRYICENGYEHHVAVAHAPVAEALHDAMSNYLGWDVYLHG